MTLKSRYNLNDTFSCEDVISEQKLIFGTNICFKDSFKVTQTDIASMNLKVKQGNAKLRGVTIVADVEETVTIETNADDSSRTDIIALEIDKLTYEAKLVVLKSKTTTTIYQMPLAKVTVPFKIT